jgi:hypothetical protein
MDTEAKRNALDLPLPEGISLRSRKFGAKPTSPPALAPVGGNKGDSSAPRRAFQLRWEDKVQGLTVVVREQLGGHLLANVFSTESNSLDKVAVSVGLVGSNDNAKDDLIDACLIRRTIPLNVPEADGCSGSADFGPLANVVAKLGPQLRLVVFLA